MSSSLNRVTLLGHIGKIETRYAASGLCIVNLSVATQEKIKDKETNETKYVPEWHRIVCFGQMGDMLALHADKGAKVFIEGSLKTNKYKDKQTGQDRYATQIIASSVEIIKKPASETPAETSKSKEPIDPWESDDIPF